MSPNVRGAVREEEDHFLLNVSDGQQNPITLEVGLVRFTGAVLMLGTEETPAHFQTEILRLTNDLSVMMHESSQKNSEL